MRFNKHSQISEIYIIIFFLQIKNLQCDILIPEMNGSHEPICFYYFKE